MTSQNNRVPKSGRQQKWIEGEDYIKNNQKNISERNSKKTKELKKIKEKQKKEKTSKTSKKSNPVLNKINI